MSHNNYVEPPRDDIERFGRIVAAVVGTPRYARLPLWVRRLSVGDPRLLVECERVLAGGVA